MKRTRTQTRVKEEQLLSSVNEAEREESFEDSENSGAIVEEPVVSETTNRPMNLEQQGEHSETETVVEWSLLAYGGLRDPHRQPLTPPLWGICAHLVLACPNHFSLAFLIKRFLNAKKTNALNGLRSEAFRFRPHEVQLNDTYKGVSGANFHPFPFFSQWIKVTLLCRIPEGSNHNASAATVGIIKLLIGHFDLDPNRVFDIVRSLSIMISFWSVLNVSLVNSIFLDLIPIFPKSHASQILGFKFQYYQRLEVNDPVPSELYQLTALLVKRDFIVDSIYAHLLPKEDAAFDHYNAFSAKRLDEANKIGRIIVAATGKDLMDEEKQGDVTVDLYAVFDMETEAVAERSSELENSQSLGLLMGFLEVDDWEKAFVASSPWTTKLTVLEKELLASRYCLRKDQALGGTL
ncbi:hypothetical protein MTR67_023593 [Solanum verrucosum]|uniref:THO complex subunit 2 N-terminal domain-containing protein n=1 Tax=Solanum verrucosum TaxID=315347 RepID=A0AAF0QVV8_SOLVR|nr:hypothetical protein MTR67_023593 [Solanum verrucosum]